MHAMSPVWLIATRWGYRKRHANARTVDECAKERHVPRKPLCMAHAAGKKLRGMLKVLSCQKRDRIAVHRDARACCATWASQR